MMERDSLDLENELKFGDLDLFPNSDPAKLEKAAAESRARIAAAKLAVESVVDSPGYQTQRASAGGETTRNENLAIEQARLGDKPFLVVAWQQNWHWDGIWIEVGILDSYPTKADAQRWAQAFCLSFESGSPWRGRPQPGDSPDIDRWVLQQGKEFTFRETIVWIAGPLEAPTIGPGLFETFGDLRDWPEAFERFLEYAPERRDGTVGPLRPWE
jgi:hypothetical protein